MRRILFLALMALQVAPAFAAGEDALSNHYSGAAKAPENNARSGWWWYQKEEEPVKEEKKKPEPEKKLEPLKEDEKKKSLRNPKLSDYSYEQLWSMHPDDFQELLMAFQKKAVQTLSKEDVEAFTYVKTIASKKSLAYANVDSMVAQQNPQYSLEQEFPLSVQAREANQASRIKDVEVKLSEASNSYALLYFYGTNCPYCVTEDKMLNVFARKYGWTVKKMNRDANQELAVQFNVQVVPTIIMVKKGDKSFFPISYGILATNEMEDKIYRSVRLMNGEISPEQWSTFETEQGGGDDPLSLPANR